MLEASHCVVRDGGRGGQISGIMPVVHDEPMDDPRPLSQAERQLVEAMLACVDEPEASALHSQLDMAEARSGCPCGCGTIDFLLPEAVPARSHREGSGVLVEGDVLDEDGEAVGGLLLFLDDGRLRDLEVWSVGDPLQLPPVESARLRAAAE